MAALDKSIIAKSILQVELSQFPIIIGPKYLTCDGTYGIIFFVKWHATRRGDFYIKWKLLVLYPTVENIILVLKIVPCKSKVSKIVHVIIRETKFTIHKYVSENVFHHTMYIWNFCLAKGAKHIEEHRVDVRRWLVFCGYNIRSLLPTRYDVSRARPSSSMFHRVLQILVR